MMRFVRAQLRNLSAEQSKWIGTLTQQLSQAIGWYWLWMAGLGKGNPANVVIV